MTSTQIPLPTGWGRAELLRAGCHLPPNAGTARAYDHEGRQLVWSSITFTRGRMRFACDLENRSRPSSDLARYFGLGKHEFTRRWVVTEVLAKLFDVPVLLWLRQRGLATGPSERVPIYIWESAASGTVAAFGFIEQGG